MVSTRPLISKYSSPLINSSVSVPRAPITIGIIVTFMFHGFFNSLTRSSYLSFFSLYFNFTLLSAETAKSTTFFSYRFFFLLILITSGHLAEIRWSACMSKSHRSFCVSFSRTDSGLCIYYLLLSFTPLEFFTSVLADSFSLEFAWQQVSSSLQDSSQYSGRSQ